MTELSPVDEADVQRIVDRMIERCHSREAERLRAENATLYAALQNCIDYWPAALNDDLQERTFEEARRVRDLIAAPPAAAPERADTVHLTRSQQRAMDRAVKRSFKIIEPPEMAALREIERQLNMLGIPGDMRMDELIGDAEPLALSFGWKRKMLALARTR